MSAHRLGSLKDLSISIESRSITTYVRRYICLGRTKTEVSGAAATHQLGTHTIRPPTRSTPTSSSSLDEALLPCARPACAPFHALRTTALEILPCLPKAFAERTDRAFSSRWRGHVKGADWPCARSGRSSPKGYRRCHRPTTHAAVLLTMCPAACGVRLVPENACQRNVSIV